MKCIPFVLYVPATIRRRRHPGFKFDQRQIERSVWNDASKAADFTAATGALSLNKIKIILMRFDHVRLLCFVVGGRGISVLRFSRRTGTARMRSEKKRRKISRPL